ncbi:MAG: Rieske 2Fe-2S domain-containing protein [Planctomycetes bacterium]|nr:Rieske 2Fe-2S domain-containing protein [Planctomycetota bacterium]
MSDTPNEPPPPERAAPAAVDRRGFLTSAAGLAMAGGLAAGYGTFAAMAGRFLYPPHPTARGWLFVSDAASLKVGDSVVYRTPAGAPVVVARMAATGGVNDFLALSSTCPHLGCQVHWEAQNNRFFCPCHNGVFDPTGKATAGPPAEAGQSLPRYPLKVDRGLLYIEVPLEKVGASPGCAARRAREC